MGMARFKSTPALMRTKAARVLLIHPFQNANHTEAHVVGARRGSRLPSLGGSEPRPAKVVTAPANGPS